MRYLVYIFLIIGFSSCNFEQIIQVELPNHESKLVVNCFAEKYSDTMLIHVTRSVGINNSFDTLPIEGAHVKLLDGENIVGETSDYYQVKKYNDMYFYRDDYPQYLYPIILNQPLEDDTEYKLEVTSEKFEKATGISRSYSGVNVLDAEFVSDIGNDITCTIKFEDLSTEENYYIISGEGGRNFYVQNGDTTWFDGVNNLYLSSNDPSVLEENDYIDYSYLYVDDATFNGETKTIKFSFYSNTEYEESKWKISISAISKDYYNFLISFDKNVDSYGDIEGFLFAPEPVIVKSNIENGIGFFGVTNFTEVEITP